MEATAGGHRFDNCPRRLHPVGADADALCSQIALFIARWFYFGDAFTQVWKIVQWFFVLGFVLLAFTSLYLFAPNLKDVKWRWLTPGSLLGVVLWLLISFGFRLYIHLFQTYSTTYGSLGAVIVLLLWLYLTGAAIILGGESQRFA